MFKKIRASEFYKNVLTLVSGTAIAQAIPIIASPFLTRLFSVDEFGVLSLFNSILAITAVIAPLSYDKGIMLPKKDKGAINMLSLAILNIIVFSILLEIVIIIFNSSISKIFKVESIGYWLYWIPLAVFFRALYLSAVYYSNRQKKYKLIARSRIIHYSSTSGGQVTSGFLSFGEFGLVGSSIVGIFVAFNFIIFKIGKTIRKSLYLISWTKIKYLAKRYVKFPLYSMPSALLNLLSVHIPIFVLSAFYSQEVIGLYGLGHRVLNLPVYVIGQSVGDVFFQKISELRNDLKALSETTFSVFRNMLLIGLIPIGTLTLFGGEIFALIFGNEWYIAGQYAEVLSPWILMVFSTSPLSRIFFVLEKQDKGFLFNVILIIVRGLSLFIGCLLFSDAYYTILLFSIVSTLAWMIFAIYILRQARIQYNRIIKLFLFIGSIFIIILLIKL